MLSIQEITQSLPPVRDDEPPSLREAIADEIIDHLQCGLRRELLLNGGDEQRARHRVLDKFGDPQTIARQLWYQAMWSKIMTQRLVIIMSSFSMVVSLALAGMMGWMIHQLAQNNAMSQAHDALLLERIAKLIPTPIAPEPQRDLNWNNLRIQVSLGSKDGPPAEGFRVSVNRFPKIGEPVSNVSSHNVKLGKEGMTDCGFVGPGVYKVMVTAPWGESSEQSFTIFPGRDHIEQCIAPAKSPEPCKVSFNMVGLPDENIATHMAFVCSVKPTGSRRIAEHDWSPTYTGWNDRAGTFSTIFVPGQGLWITDNKQMLGGIPDQGFNVTNSTWKPCQLPLEFEFPEHEHSVEYSLVKLREPVNPEEKWRDRVLAGLDGVTNRYHMPDKLFCASGKQNEWTISIPEVVLKCLNEDTFLPPVRLGTGQGGGFF